MNNSTSSSRRMTYLKVERYRSIKDNLHIDFPENTPLILVGENNAGKSNVVRALDLVLGERWTKSHEPADHEFWDRNTDNSPIKIKVGLQGVEGSHGHVQAIEWEYSKGVEPLYEAIYSSTRKWVSNEIREQCVVITMGADRKLSYQMSYSTKWTLLSKLMTKFHDRLVSNDDRVTRLKSKFKEIKTIFDEVNEFLNFRGELQEHFDSMLAGMSYSLGIDFSAYDPSNFFHSLKIFPQENGEPRNFEELGTGQEQVLAFAFAHAYAKAFFGGIVLVVEEPEAHLHPLAQLWLARKIREMAKDGLQIVITTHSPAFVSIIDLPGLVLICKENGATKAKQISAKYLAEFCVEYGAQRNGTNDQTVLPFYSSNCTQEIMAGLFAKKVVLVEGQTEQLSLPIYLSKVGLDVEKQGIAIIPVMGKGNIAKWWRFFSAYSLPVYLVFDNDNDDDKKGNKRRDILSTLKLDTSSAEDYLVAHDWIVQERFALFGLDFEKTLRENFSSYETLEAEAKENLGDTKPIVARYVAEKLEYNTSDAGWSRINELKNMLVALVAKPSSILFESSPTMPNATDFSVAPSTLLDDEDPFAAQPPF